MGFKLRKGSLSSSITFLCSSFSSLTSSSRDKSVTFDRKPQVHLTYAPSDYDRSPIACDAIKKKDIREFQRYRDGMMIEMLREIQERLAEEDEGHAWNWDILTTDRRDKTRQRYSIERPHGRKGSCI